MCGFKILCEISKVPFEISHKILNPCIFCGVWVQNFLWNFKGALWNFTQKCWTHTPQNMHFSRCKKFEDLWYLECYDILTHWGRVTHICVSKLTTIGSDNGLSPERRQAIIWTNAGILLIGTLGTNFSEIVSAIHTFSFMKMHLKMSCGTWRPFCVSFNVLSVSERGSCCPRMGWGEPLAGYCPLALASMATMHQEAILFTS